MPELTYPIIAILVGFVGLIWSADRFVDGSASIAKAAGLSPVVIGLTIVSFGTSAPEVLVSLNAALSDAGSLAIGNALGSNLANVGLVLGVTALVATLPVQQHLLRHELPILLAITAVAGWFLFDATLVFWESLVLLGLLVPAMAYLVIVKKKTFTAAEAQEDFTALTPKMAIIWFALGLVLLIAASKILVWGATETATYLGVSPLIIGLTVVAVGTSLPELAASVASALKGHHDIALGNVIGSNMFNLLAVMSIPGFFAPLAMESKVFSRDYIAMAAITGLLAILMWVGAASTKRGTGGIGKLAGILLLGSYAAYYYALFHNY